MDGGVERGTPPRHLASPLRVARPAAVTAVIPTGGKLDLLRPCLDDLLERTDYPNLEILLVDNSNGDEVERLVAELAQRYPACVAWSTRSQPFNYSALVNSAIPHVTTPFVLMLNDDITVIEPGWLRAMVELANGPRSGSSAPSSLPGRHDSARRCGPGSVRRLGACLQAAARATIPASSTCPTWSASAAR